MKRPRANGDLLSFKRSRRNLDTCFRIARGFVSKVDPRLAWTKLNVGCPEIEKFRKDHNDRQGARAFMHVGHIRGSICTAWDAERLPTPNILLGLFLHEFGHLGSGGGERDADRWVSENFGIPIFYRTRLDIEWIGDPHVRKVVRGSGVKIF